MNGLGANAGNHGVEDGINPPSRAMHQIPGELTIFQSPQSNSFLAGNGGAHTPHYDDTLAQSKMEMMKSAGGVAGTRPHDGVGAGVGSNAPPGGYSGIQQAVNRKEKRFFQKKDL